MASSIKNYLVRYFTLTDDLLPQADAESTIRDGVSFKGTNMLILILAIFIASLGLNTNSTAVIIGAMLISPLMGPIIGIGLGVGIQDFELLKRSLRNLVMAAAFSVLTSTIYFLISPVSEGHSELLARTSPTIYDVLIGFFGGGAGIVAIGSKSKGNVIPGVAIATALMPPLCTAGYGIATWQFNYFLGAFYLFLINSIFIGLSTFIGVKLMHYKPVVSVNPERSRKVRHIVYTVSILTLLPSLYLTYNMLRQSRFSANADRFISQQFNFPSTQVLSHSATIAHGDRVITVTLIGKVLPTDSLRIAMASQLKNYGLEGARLHIIQGDSPDLSELKNGLPSMNDIYEFARTSISAQQVTIDSLRSIIALSRINDTISGRIAPEVKILFPQIEELAITRSVFGNISTQRLDTINIVLVKYGSSLPKGKEPEFVKYLEARLQLPNLQLVNIGNQVSFDKNTPHTQSKK
ncbi:MAG: TIGR00341 family protein [Staphylococcus sp.]|nr:TIGR00341 family protein [Staphylococcus sp.]